VRSSGPRPWLCSNLFSSTENGHCERTSRLWQWPWREIETNSEQWSDGAYRCPVCGPANFPPGGRLAVALACTSVRSRFPAREEPIPKCPVRRTLPYNDTALPVGSARRPRDDERPGVEKLSDPGQVESRLGSTRPTRNDWHVPDTQIGRYSAPASGRRGMRWAQWGVDKMSSLAILVRIPYAIAPRAVAMCV
jgi:hypothetical protein